ncbi:MAG: shikimate kinase [Sphingomonadales bacterium]|nr:shikimate kinase [Sphingomonadales bacterium]
MRIYLIGFMGAGKSFWGPRLAREAGFRFFDLDQVLEESQGERIDTIFSQHGEEAFRQLEKDCLHLLTESHTQFVMACGGGTPCFLNNIEYMKQSGKVVWVNPAVETIAQRLTTARQQRPLLQSVTDEELLGYIQKKMADRRLYYEQADLRIDEEPIDLSAVLKSLLHA